MILDTISKLSYSLRGYMNDKLPNIDTNTPIITIALPGGVTSYTIYPNVVVNGKPSIDTAKKECDHTPKTYTGLTETFEYCTKCDAKLGNV